MEAENILPIKGPDGEVINIEIRKKNIVGKLRKVKVWSSTQDSMLLKLHKQYPKKWEIIASLMHDRNQNQCLHRYRRLSQLDSHCKIWSSEEDQRLIKLVKKIGKNWKLLSQNLGSKTAKQIRQRFINKLDPKIKKQGWSYQQDQKLIQLYTKLGSKWSLISKEIQGRPQNHIKNRFYSFIQKNYDFRYKKKELQIKRQTLAQISTDNKNQPLSSPSSITQIYIDVQNNVIFNNRLFLQSCIRIQCSPNNNHYSTKNQFSCTQQFQNQNRFLSLPSS